MKFIFKILESLGALLVATICFILLLIAVAVMLPFTLIYVFAEIIYSFIFEVWVDYESIDNQQHSN